MNEKISIKSISIVLSIVLVLCCFSSIIGYAELTKSSNSLYVVSVTHRPTYPIAGEESVTFSINLSGLTPGSTITCEWWNNSTTGIPDPDIIKEFYVEGNTFTFEIGDWMYTSAGQNEARLEVTDNSGSWVMWCQEVRVGSKSNRDIKIEPETQVPRMSIFFSTGELIYDDCGWIFDDNNPSSINNGLTVEGLIYTGISGREEEGVYNGRFVEIEKVDNYTKEFYITKFSYEILISQSLEEDCDQLISDLNDDKNKKDNFSSDTKSFISLYNQIMTTDQDILNELFGDEGGINIAEDISALFSIYSDAEIKKTALSNINDTINNMQYEFDFDFDIIENRMNYLKENQIRKVEDIPLGTDSGLFIIPEWADDYMTLDLPWIEEDEDDLSSEDVIIGGINYYKDELIKHLRDNKKLKGIYEHVSQGLEIDLVTLAIWFAIIFILSVVVVQTLPLFSIFLALTDALILSIIVVFLLDNANFQTKVSDFIKERLIQDDHPLSEAQWEAVISIVIFVLIFGSFAGLSLVPLIGTLVSSLTIVGITASAYILVPLIKDMLDFEEDEDDDTNSRPVTYPISNRQIFRLVLLRLFYRSPYIFPILRKIF